MELIGFAQRVMGPAAPKKTPSEAHAAQAHAAGFDAVDGRAPTPDAPEEEKKVCSFFLTDFRKINIVTCVCDGVSAVSSQLLRFFVFSFFLFET